MQFEALLRAKLDLNIGFMRRIVNTAYRTVDYIIGFGYFLVRNPPARMGMAATPSYWRLEGIAVHFSCPRCGTYGLSFIPYFATCAVSLTS